MFWQRALATFFFFLRSFRHARALQHRRFFDSAQMLQRGSRFQDKYCFPLERHVPQTCRRGATDPWQAVLTPCSESGRRSGGSFSRVCTKSRRVDRWGKSKWKKKTKKHLLLKSNILRSFIGCSHWLCCGSYVVGKKTALGVDSFIFFKNVLLLPPFFSFLILEHGWNSSYSVWCCEASRVWLFPTRC